VTSLVCPNCGASVPVDPGYVSWCDACDWNVKPRVRHDKGGRLDRIADALGQRLGDRLAIELLRAEELKPRLTPAKVAAYAIALAVHAFVFGLAALGLWLLLQDPGAFFPSLGGILLLGLAFLMRPRLGKRPQGVLPRDAAPVTCGLVDEVAAAVGTRPPDVIAITPGYNASWSRTGLRRERVLRLGLPLLVTLEPQERVALIAHELAHSRHGDATRGFVVGSAIDALAQLHITLTPGHGVYGASGLDLAELVTRPFVWLVAQPIRLLLLLELHLLLRESQRTEYLADALAARAAGTAAMVGTHEKLLLDETFRLAVHRATVGERHDRDRVFELLEQASAAMPERERERRRRVARLETSRLGSTHPPTAKRIELLQARPQHEPAVTLDAERAAAMDAEFEPLRVPLSRRLSGRYAELVHG
jgi:Zn-dependent protease with chaperone function